MREDESPDWSWTPDELMPDEAELDRRVLEQERIHRTPSPLTLAQVNVLRLLSHGGSYASIARQTGVPYERVRDEAQEARRKLAAKSDSHAVALAYRAKLID